MINKSRIIRVIERMQRGLKGIACWPSVPGIKYIMLCISEKFARSKKSPGLDLVSYFKSLIGLTITFRSQDLRNPCVRGTLTTPGYEIAQHPVFSFRFYINRTIWLVFHKAFEAQLQRLFHGIIAKSNSLYQAVDRYIQALSHLYQIQYVRAANWNIRVPTIPVCKPDTLFF